MQPDFSKNNGLLSVILQDSHTKQVLMNGFMNEEAFKKTTADNVVWFYSRSKERLWKKGETSGNVMKVVELRIDCDGDTLLAIVDPAGPACHTGKRTCFYRSLWGKENSTEATFLGRLWQYLNKRRSESPEESYTARLLAKGPSRVAQKVGEEGVETAIAAATGDRDGFRYEAADLLYHLLVACISTGVSFKEVLDELMSRHKKDED